MIRTPITAILATATCLSAQNISEGPFVGVPIHALVGDNTSNAAGATLETDSLYLKRPGFNADIIDSPPFAPPNVPDFSWAAMVQGLFRHSSGTYVQPASLDGIRFRSISSGHHTVFASYQPVAGLPGLQPILTIPQNAWGAVFFSVTSDSIGEATSVIRTEANATTGEGPGADVFSMILPGSEAAFPPSLLNCTTIGMSDRANDSSEMGIASIGSPELEDFDAFFPFYESEDSPSFLHVQPYVYFTLDNAVAAQIASLNVGWVYGPGNESGATILKMRWDHIAREWGDPQVLVDFNELGFPQSYEIDSLAVDEIHQKVLLSVTYASSADPDHQLMISDLTGGMAGGNLKMALTYRHDDGSDGVPVRITQVMGVKSGDDIDAVCEVDPATINGVVTMYYPYTHACREILGGTGSLSSSAFAVRGAVTTDLTVSVSGLLTPVGPTLGAFLLWGESDNTDPFSATPQIGFQTDYFPFSTALGWSFAPATSQVASITYPISTSLLTGGTLLDFQWLQIDSTGFYQSNVVSFRF